MTYQFQSFGAGRALAAFVAASLPFLAQDANAQLQLPGAFAPAPAGTVAAPPRAGKPKSAHKAIASPPRVPSDDAVVGRALMLNGRAGVMEFGRAGKDLQISHLKLSGDLISRVGDRCQVDLSSAPIALEPAGKPAGVTRYLLKLPACPFSVDILEGAALAIREGGACEFTAADCRVNPAGLWGQPASEIGAKRAKEIEHQRRKAETTMRENYRAWVSAAGKDRALVRRIAHEQAGFSSRREEVCRTYAREAEHGYCALLTTEAWAIALAAHALPAEEPDEDRPPPRKGARRR